jgi:hypothetical protein
MESHQHSILLGAIYTICGAVLCVCQFVYLEIIWMISLIPSRGIWQINYFWIFLKKRVIRLFLRLHVSLECNVFLHVNERETKGLVHSEISLAEGKLCSNSTIVLNDPLCPAALIVRTWAVWHQNRYVGCGLAIMWICVVIVGFIFAADFVKSFDSMWFTYSYQFHFTSNDKFHSKPKTLRWIPGLLRYQCE